MAARERELAQAAGQTGAARPRYADEQRATSVVRLHRHPPADKSE